MTFNKPLAVTTPNRIILSPLSTTSSSEAVSKFRKRRNCSKMGTRLASTSTSSFETEDGYVLLDEEDNNDHDRTSSTENNENETKSQMLYNTLVKALKKALETNERKMISLQNEYEKAQEYESLKHRADLIMANLYMFTSSEITEVTVQDWGENMEDVQEILLKLNTKDYTSAQEEAESIYTKVRKMKRGTTIIQEKLEEATQQRNLLEQQQKQLSIISEEESKKEEDLIIFRQMLFNSSKRLGIKEKDLEVVKSPQQSSRNTSRKQQQPQQQRQSRSSLSTQHSCRQFQTPDNQHTVYVGKNRYDNEYLSFHFAKGQDIWMHARGVPGAHVVLKVSRSSSQISDESLQFAANLAAFYSEARSERKAVITTAEPKHIQKPKGAPPGAVKLRQELGSLVGRPEDVPSECKEAREESGYGWDEMGTRSLGLKSKNRKQTAAHTKQKQDLKHSRRLQKQRLKRQKQTKTGSSTSITFYDEEIE